MKKIFRFYVGFNRKRRYLAVKTVLWMLRLIRDVEEEEMGRYSDLLDSYDWGNKETSRSEYTAIEEEYTTCEYTLAFLESAIEDLEYAY